MEVAERAKVHGANAVRFGNGAARVSGLDSSILLACTGVID